MKKNVKINYLELIKDSVKFTWSYKILWIFGFILAFFATNAGGGYNGSTSTGNEADSTKIEDWAEKLKDILASPLFWIILLAVIVIGLLVGILIWYLKSVARIAIFNAVRLDLKGKKDKIRFKSLWGNSHSKLFRVFKYDLLWAIITFPLMLALILFIIGLIFSFNFIGIFCAVCFLVPVILILSVAVSILKNIGFRVLLLTDLSLVDTLKLAYRLTQKNFGQVILSLIILNIPLALIGFALGLITFVLFLPLMLALLVTILISPAVFIMFLIFFLGVALIIGILIALVNSPLKVYYESYMTRFVACFLDEKEIVEGEIIDCC